MEVNLSDVEDRFENFSKEIAIHWSVILNKYTHLKV
jgi:hypothetical protein